MENLITFSDHDTILDNIKYFYENASPDTLKEINEILSSDSGDDISIEEYIDAVLSQYSYY